MDKMCKIFGIFGITTFIIMTTVFMLATLNMLMNENASAQSPTSDQCKIYYDKAKQLAKESAEDLPAGITRDFDPRMAKSNSSIAYSQIYKNCKEYGE